MKIYTREQVEKIVKESYGNPRYRNNYNNLKTWCKKNELYYEGVIRFFKGADITVYTYFKILHAADDSFPVVRRTYLSDKITYSDLSGLAGFLKEICFK
jgi:hypothetical protein